MNRVTSTYGYATHALAQKGPLRAGVATATTAKTATTTTVRIAVQDPSRVAFPPLRDSPIGSEVDAWSFIAGHLPRLVQRAAG